MRLLLLLSTLVISGMLHGQGINFFHGTWEEALEQAAQKQKLIFVDAYAKWCGPCKRMAKNVFTQQTVGDYFNENFINMKIDMEEGMGLAFRQKYRVSAFPTLFFIDENGEIVKKSVGGKRTDDFISLGKGVVASHDRSGDFAQQYEKGNRDYPLVLSYIKAMNKKGTSSSKVANDYLRNNPNLSGERLNEFLFESVTTSDSRIFDQYIKHISGIKAKYGEEAAMEKINVACRATIETAITFESKDLLIETQELMANHYPMHADEFRQMSNIDYARAMNDISLLRESIREYSESTNSQGIAKKVELVEELLLYQQLDDQIADTAEEIMNQIIRKNDNPEYRLLYAQILHQNDKTKKALKEAQKAYKNLDEKDACHDDLERFIESIKAK